MTVGRGRRTDGAPPRAEPLERLTEGVRRLRVGEGSGRRLMVLGGVLVPLGVLVVLLGWIGASRTSNVYEQIPYLISGGLLGLALVFVGGFLYFAHWLTRLVQEQRTRSAAVVDAVNRLVEVVERSSVARPAGNGHQRFSPAPAAEPEPEPALVATGTGSLAHRPTCRVVAGKPDVRVVTVDDGLAPCRLCDPYA